MEKFCLSIQSALCHLQKNLQKLQISIYENFNTIQIPASHIYHRISVYVQLKYISTIPPAKTSVQN